jgi:hypothetical protein
MTGLRWIDVSIDRGRHEAGAKLASPLIIALTFNTA